MAKILHVNATPEFMENPKNVEMIQRLAELAEKDIRDAKSSRPDHKHFEDDGAYADDSDMED